MIIPNSTVQNTHDLSSQTIAEAMEFWLALGFNVIPAIISKGVKKTLVKFSDQRDKITPELSRSWLTSFPNAQALAVTTDNGLFVLDTDTPESLLAARQLEAKFGIYPKLIVATRNGEHHFFRIESDVSAVARGFDSSKSKSNIDIRTRKSIVIVPPSRRDGVISYSITLNNIRSINDLNCVTQKFVNAIFSHNSDELPTEKNTKSMLIERWGGESIEIDKTKKLLSFIDSEISYEDWLKVIFGVVSKFGKTQEAINLIDEWSSSASNYSGIESICYKVQTISLDGGITFATVRHMAKQGGADLALIEKAESAESLSLDCFEDALEALKKNSENSEALSVAMHCISTSKTLIAKRQTETLSLVISLSPAEIRKEIKKQAQSMQRTHYQIAQKVVDNFGQLKPVGAYGKIWTYSFISCIWEATEIGALEIKIGHQFTNERLCSRKADYSGIAKLVYSIVADENFFDSAPQGLQTPDGFYCVNGYSLECLPSSPDNRARFKVLHSPNESCSTENFRSFLSFAFGKTFDQQFRLIILMLGLALLGQQSKHQTVCFLYGVGGSGKSTFLKIIESLVPSEYIGNVSPVDMDSDFKKASLVGKLLNLVPEMEKDFPIPSAAFKSITGDDSISARQIYGQAFSFRSYAGNWFNGNFFPTTKDHSDAFFRRWKFIHFIHAVPPEKRDTGLCKRIIDNELPGILDLAFTAVIEHLLLGEYFPHSDEHEGCLRNWITDSNSVKSWLNDDDNNLLERDENNSSTPPILKTRAYDMYCYWCKRNHRRPFSKSLYDSFMGESGHVATSYQGYMRYKGLIENVVVPVSSNHQF